MTSCKVDKVGMTGSNNANPDFLNLAHHYCKWEGILSLLMIVYRMMNHYSVFLVISIPESDFVEIGGIVLQYFIVTYEELPVLWNPTDSNYENKMKRRKMRKMKTPPKHRQLVQHHVH